MYYGASHLRLKFSKLSGESNMSQAKALNLKGITNIIKEHKEEIPPLKPIFERILKNLEE